MSRPSDTSKMSDEAILAQGIAVGPSAMMTGMEAAGQQEVVDSTAIPTEMHCAPGDLEALGFKLGPVHADDPLFREAKLPKGWAREGSSHAMWSYIIDERGYRRVSVFYKAAFYDRAAHVGIVRTPATAKQMAALEPLDEWCPRKAGWFSAAGMERDGDDLVYTAKQARMEGGRMVYDREAGDWAWTGLVRQRVVASDGSTIKDREFCEASMSGASLPVAREKKEKGA